MKYIYLILLSLIFVLTGCSGGISGNSGIDLSQYYGQYYEDVIPELESDFDVPVEEDPFSSDDEITQKDGIYRIRMKGNGDIYYLQYEVTREPTEEDEESPLANANVCGIKPGMDIEEALNIISDLTGKDINSYLITSMNEYQLDDDKMIFFTYNEGNSESGTIISSIGIREGEANEYIESE